MIVFQQTLSVETRGQRLYEITEDVAYLVGQSGVGTGLASVFCQHTSCSLVIMENADATARADLEAWLNRLVPENDPNFRHTLEGPDDMPSHIKMALTRTSETMPVSEKRMQLGAWQGIFLWEHRRHPHTRNVIVTVLGQ